MKVACATFVVKMPRKSVSLLSKRGLALKVLSKLLYAVADNTTANEELKVLHQKILDEYMTPHELAIGSETEQFAMEEIPWDKLLDTIANTNSKLRPFRNSNRFTVHEPRYICAMICGLTGREYQLVSGFKSQYNLSWSIRQKLGMLPKTTNLQNYLLNLTDFSPNESRRDVAQK